MRQPTPVPARDPVPKGTVPAITLGDQRNRPRGHRGRFSRSPGTASGWHVAVVAVVGAGIGALFHQLTMAPFWQASEPPHYFGIVLFLPIAWLGSVIVLTLTLALARARGRDWLAMLSCVIWWPLSSALFRLWIHRIVPQPMLDPDCCYSYDPGEPYPLFTVIGAFVLLQVGCWLLVRRASTPWPVRVGGGLIALVPVANELLRLFAPWIPTA